MWGTTCSWLLSLIILHFQHWSHLNGWNARKHVLWFYRMSFVLLDWPGEMWTWKSCVLFPLPRKKMSFVRIAKSIGFEVRSLFILKVKQTVWNRRMFLIFAQTSFCYRPLLGLVLNQRRHLPQSSPLPMNVSIPHRSVFCGASSPLSDRPCTQQPEGTSACEACQGSC